MQRLFSSLLAGLFGALAVQAQQNNIITTRDYPVNYFRSPLNITPDASGTFGELRSTHFHAGDDYRTQQRTGLPVYAVADGQVSRVRVQIGGGGNSVYIDHPNGYTSVYLHLENFNDALTNIVRAEQYKQKKFDVDVMVAKGTLSFQKGDVIANSGNTGASGGPHLHFEIRDTKSQHPLNTQLFGLQFTDRFAPTIQGLMVYDLGESMFNENTFRRPVSVRAVNGTDYRLSNNAAIQVNGKFGLGINTIDRHRAGGFQNGVYSIELFIDGQPMSTVLFEELDFNTSRGIHSYIDYAQWKRSKAKYQKSFKDPGNPIEIFHHLPNDGILELKDNQVHDVKYVVKDVKGNCSELNFQIQNSANYQPKANTVKGQLMSYNKNNQFAKDHIQLDIPKGVLYTDLDFLYSSSAKPAGGYSEIHHVHNPMTPLFSTYQLKIKPTSLPERLRDKALIASTQSGSEGGKYEDGWVVVNTRNLGSFYVAVDTVAPSITPRNLSQGKNVAQQSRIDFTISDNFSGVQSFDGYIDGEWVLMEYDPKNRHLWHTFQSSLSKGKHEFRLVVKDWKDNERIYQAEFTR